MAHDLHVTTYDHAYRDGGNPARGVVYGYTTYGIPLSTNNWFYDAMGYSVPDRTICLRAWANGGCEFLQSS